MKIVVYDCVTGDKLTDKYGRTGALIIDWIAPHLPEAEFDWVHVAGCAAMPKPDSVDGIIISGSEKGVYDDVPWMAPLRENLQDMRSADVAMFGICFGHQIMADVFGGKAELVDKGYVTGAKEIEMDGEPSAAYVAHQDQVTEIPAEAAVIASAPYCPVAALSYDFPAMSVQFHPEYDAAFARDLIDMFGDELMSQPEIDAARASIPGAVPKDLYVARIADFFRKNIAS